MGINHCIPGHNIPLVESYGICHCTVAALEIAPAAPGPVQAPFLKHIPDKVRQFFHLHTHLVEGVNHGHLCVVKPFGFVVAVIAQMLHNRFHALPIADCHNDEYALKHEITQAVPSLVGE